MIEIPQLVNAASHSTAMYLGLLTQSGKGKARHSASNVSLSPRRSALIGNQTWPVIQCELPKHENFPPDSGAIFVPTNNPGTQIGAQILAYDRRSGLAEIAVEELPTGKDGELVIDFKWLVQRCLDWLTKNGSSISNPFLLSPRVAVQVQPVSRHVSLSGEQLDAIKALLSNSAGYVWGPPGTGKTRHVLAETVAHLIQAGNRVLVAAPTNLAVDNALDAVLRLGCVPVSKILRLGIPSSEFSRNWPECCEERARQRKLNEMEARAQWITVRIDSKLRSESLDGLILEQKEIAAACSKVANELDEACREMNRQVVAAEERLSSATNGCHRTEREIGERQALHVALKLDHLRDGIGALEMDQMKLVSERQSLEKGLANIGLLARVFTRRREELTHILDAANRRLVEVESTLKNQRQRLDQLEAREAELESEIGMLKVGLLALVTAQQESELARSHLVTDNFALLERQSHAKTEVNDAGEKLCKMLQEHEELMNLGDFPDDFEIKSLRAELIKIGVEMARITQDLTEKLVLGMTLDGFIGLTMNQALHFDHILVDEAGYAPLAKILPLLVQGCPISLLGDHRQLPPVYVANKDAISESYWGVSALYLEEVFQSGIGDDPQQMVLCSKKDPRFQQMHRSQLTTSYRFGPELADLLDRHFYKIGLQSYATTGTNIRWRDCPQLGPFSSPNRKKRENAAEASRIIKAVKSWVEWEASDKGTLAILTPYKNHVILIRLSLKDLQSSAQVGNWQARHWEDFRQIEVMTVHQSQGREWDSVFFSASDTGHLGGNKPFLADTSCFEGKLVVNTAISRSKKYLRFFFDRQFWKDRAVPSLLTEVAQ